VTLSLRALEATTNTGQGKVTLVSVCLATTLSVSYNAKLSCNHPANRLYKLYSTSTDPAISNSFLFYLTIILSEIGASIAIPFVFNKIPYIL
jgi:predicted acylesterase/phospholipase RssA